MKKIIVTLLCALAPLCNAGDAAATQSTEEKNYAEIAQKRKIKIQKLKYQSYWKIGFAFSLGSCLRFNRLIAMPAAIISSIGAFKPDFFNTMSQTVSKDSRFTQVTTNVYKVFQRKIDDFVKKTDELAKQKPEDLKENNTSNKTE